LDTYKVLFLCTGNSARSIMAEAILNELGAGRFKASSAGSHPAGAINPGAIRQLADRGYDTGTFRSKSWAEFAGADAPRFDFIVTVCDNAAGETCPLWPGRPLTAHWSIADPAAATGSERTVRQAFVRAFDELSGRIGQLLELPLQSMSRQEMQMALRAPASTQGSD
jgi:arsenate reductase